MQVREDQSLSQPMGVTELSDKLTEVQPILSKLAEEPSLRSLFKGLATVIENVSDDDPVGLSAVPQRINDSFVPAEQSEKLDAIQELEMATV